MLNKPIHEKQRNEWKLGPNSVEKLESYLSGVSKQTPPLKRSSLFPNETAWSPKHLSITKKKTQSSMVYPLHRLDTRGWYIVVKTYNHDARNSQRDWTLNTFTANSHVSGNSQQVRTQQCAVTLPVWQRQWLNSGAVWVDHFVRVRQIYYCTRVCVIFTGDLLCISTVTSHARLCAAYLLCPRNLLVLFF